MRGCTALLLLVTFLAGCSHGRKAPVVTNTEAPSIASIPVMTPGQPTHATVAHVNDDPMPVYRSPKLTKVKVDAYINERGEAFPETVKFVFVDEGGWNIEALRNPERAYIPAENTQKPLAAPGVLWGAIAPGEMAAVPSPSAMPVRKLFDMDQVRITGYVERSDEGAARVEADRVEHEFGPCVVVFDDDLGWLIVPQAALNPVAGISRAGGATVPAVRRPATTSDEDVK